MLKNTPTPSPLNSQSRVELSHIIDIFGNRDISSHLLQIQIMYVDAHDSLCSDDIERVQLLSYMVKVFRANETLLDTLE